MAVVILPSLFLSCSNDEDNMLDTNGNLSNLQTVALNISEETENADILLLCNDGSYLVCDVNNDNGYGTIYINSSVNNDISKGITIYLDENGTPIMASTENGDLLFKNITDNSFDFAFIDKKGHISYYWDIPFPYISNVDQAATRAWYDPWVYSWKEFGSTVVHWSWDEHQKKAIVPFLCKMGSFAITATGVVYGGPGGIACGIYTLVDETMKSGGWKCDLFSKFGDFASLVNGSSSSKIGGWGEILKDGKLTFSPKGFGISALGLVLNEYGDQALANLGKYEEMVAQTFEGKEWQIKLSTYLLECSIKESTYTVDVSTLAAWKIDDSNIDKSWCNIYKENEKIIVKVKEYDGIEDRVCFAKIKTSAYETSDIPPATLTIKQSGVLFELSAPELVFTQEGGTQGVNVNTNKTVTSWKVTSRPKWCTTEEWDVGLLVTVEEDEHLLEDREGIITATAQLTNGTSIDRYLIVKQIVQDTWNGTKWKFTGNVNASGNASMVGSINMSEVTNFGIEIRDVDRNDFSLSGDLAGLESKSSIKRDEDNNLIWSYSETMSDSGASMRMYANITFTRTSTTTATGKMSSSVNVNIPGYGEYTSISMSGNFNGNLIQ
ncbi:MAG: BACON domain-containing protein [Bacteroidaceae bacterium]|nr:BACON domain-containing protein [Bacteroidaceae bacterium]